MRRIAVGFHDVVEERHLAAPIAVGHSTLYTLSRKDLREHLHAIRCRVGPEAVQRVDQAGANGARHTVFLTFDDGALSSYTCVAQELDDAGWPGHFFVTTDWIGRKGFLNRDQIRELRDRGHVIGSHSCSHPERMSHLSAAALAREWHDSCAILSQITGEAAVVASVPGGYYSRRVARAAAAAGIKVLFTSEPTSAVADIDGCLVLGRYAVWRHTPARVVAAIAAGALWPRLRQAGLWSLKQVLKRVAGRHYGVIRGKFLLGSGCSHRRTA